MQLDSPYLEIIRLNKRFGIFEALKDIDLEVNQSELICLLGPSGCGKTTVLRCIAGLETPTSGQIFQDGIDVAPLPPDKRDFGIVFQSYALFPNLTVNENLAFGLKNRKFSKDEIAKRIKQLKDTVGLQGQGAKFPSQLSGGQQQRVALSRALATSPSLLLLDEPLSALDAKVRQHLRREILQLQRNIGITTILVTHDQEEALTMGDRIVVMDHGVIAQIGTPDEIYGSPKSAFVADFIGEMNFLAGVMTSPELVMVDQIEFLYKPSYNPQFQNENVHLCIRPEDIVINRESTEPNGNNTALAIIQSTEYLGSIYRIRMAFKISTQTEFVAQVPPAKIRDLNLDSGQIVEVEFPLDRLHIYPRST